MMTRYGLLAGLLAVIYGCAPTHVPLEIRQTPERDLTVEDVRKDIGRYEGTMVRWGGTIASVENKKDETWIEIVASTLGGSGRPRIMDVIHGRFLARIDGFLDPQIYAEQRELTVYGKVEGKVEQAIGEHPYTYPLVGAHSHYLWREYVDTQYSRHDYPYRYYGPYPYSHRFLYGRRYPWPHPYLYY